MSTHNACFHGEIRKISRHGKTSAFSRVMDKKSTFHIDRLTHLPEGTSSHYENMPIQIYRKFHFQKLKNFR